MLTEGQLREGARLTFEPDPLKRVLYILEAEISFIEDWVQAKRRVVESVRQANEPHDYSQSARRNAPPKKKNPRKA